MPFKHFLMAYPHTQWFGDETTACDRCGMLRSVYDMWTDEVDLEVGQCCLKLSEVRHYENQE